MNEESRERDEILLEKLEEIDESIFGFRYEFNMFKEGLDIVAFSEKMDWYLRSIEESRVKTFDSEKRLNSMMLELKGIVGMARGALEASKKLKLLDEILNSHKEFNESIRPNS